VRVTRTILVAATMWLAAACGSSAPTIESIDNAKTETVKPERAQVKWRQPIVRTLLEAEQSHKPIMMYFHLDGCPYCLLMEQNTLQTAEIIEKLNANFIPVWLNVEDHFDNMVALGIRHTPAIVFLAPDGSLLGGVEGVLTSRDLLFLLNAIDAYTKTESQSDSIRTLIREPEREQYRL
jgi:thioredoxin-related protein